MKWPFGADTGEEVGESEVGGAFLVLTMSSPNRKLVFFERKEEVIVCSMAYEIFSLRPEGQQMIRQSAKEWKETKLVPLVKKHEGKSDENEQKFPREDIISELHDQFYITPSSPDVFPLAVCRRETRAVDMLRGCYTNSILLPLSFGRPVTLKNIFLFFHEEKGEKRRFVDIFSWDIFLPCDAAQPASAASRLETHIIARK